MGTAGTDRRVFFKTVPYPSHTRARRGYTGTTSTGITGTGTGVLGNGLTGTGFFFAVFVVFYSGYGYGYGY
jgi:hypothetical protein